MRRACASAPPRVMAMLSARCLVLPTHDGFTTALLRERIAVLLGTADTGSPMTYDLRRLRRTGLIHRLPGKHRSVLTVAGRRTARFFSKAYARVLRPSRARLDPAVPPDPSDALATAWRRLDQAVEHHLAAAKLAA